jgi:hypothetical protein
LNAWQCVIDSLQRQAHRPPSLADWLMQASPGDKLLVRCDTPTQKSNVQSRVNRIARTRAIIGATAIRVCGGVLVERLATEAAGVPERTTA